LEASEIDTIQKTFIDSLFRGKEKENNRKVLKELLLHGEMTHYTLASRVFGDKYSTAHGRVIALKNLGVVEKKGERPGTKNKQPTVLWGLSSLGFWITVHEWDEGKEKCRKLISNYWKDFTEIYHLDEVETEDPLYPFFTEWLESDQGMIEFLDNFGHAALASRENALVGFRRMVDLGLLMLHTGRDYVFNVSERAVLNRDPYEALGEIARNHKIFGKLDAVLSETDAPLYAESNKAAYEELLRKLSFVPQSLAKKLAETPLLTYQSPLDRSGTLPYVSTRSLKETLAEAKKRLTGPRKGRLYLPISEIVIEGDRICIVTNEPEEISSVWKDNCDLYVVRREHEKGVVFPMRRSK